MKTSNKKYYKRFDVPDLKRAKIDLDESEVVWKYQNNTVIIGYDKPAAIIEADKKKKKDIATMGNDGGGAGSFVGGRGGGDVRSMLGGPQSMGLGGGGG